MLVLSRKKSERIMVSVPPSTEPQTIEVVVTDIRGDKAKIGLKANADVVIHRQEVYDEIQKEKLTNDRNT